VVMIRVTRQDLAGAQETMALATADAEAEPAEAI